MIWKIIDTLLGQTPQRRQDAIEATKELAYKIRLTGNSRSIDETIGYLIKNNIDVQYKGVK